MAKKKSNDKRRAKLRARRTPPTTETQPQQALDIRAPMQLYLSGQHEQLCKWMLSALQILGKQEGTEIPEAHQKVLDLFVETWLFLFCQPDFRIPDDYVEEFVLLNTEVSNIVALSRNQTTDPQVEMLSRDITNLPKTLTLLSARNNAEVDYKPLFDMDPRLASLWYHVYYESATAKTTATLLRNIQSHLTKVDNRLEIVKNVGPCTIFLSHYADPENARGVIEKTNQLITQRVAHLKVQNTPTPNRIAIATHLWGEGSAVYRAYSPMVAELAKHYDLTLIHLSQDRPDLDTSLFTDVRQIRQKADETPDISSIAENDFQAIFYPDMHCVPEASYLANLRIAPIQVMAYGCLSSNWGSQIDYYLGSTELDIVENAQKHYYERFVAIPGLGACLTVPQYQPVKKERSDDTIRVACPWTAQKVRYPVIQLLQRILGQTQQKVELYFLNLPKSFPPKGNFPAFAAELRQLLGKDTTRILPFMGEEYYQALSECDLVLDSYPFAGYTGIIDSLHTGVPIVTRCGERCFNRASQYVLGKAGLSELVAYDDEQYVDIACRMIDNADYRNEIKQRIDALNLDELLADTETPVLFKKAFDYIIQNHEQLKTDTSRNAILIEA